MKHRFSYSNIRIIVLLLILVLSFPNMYRNEVKASSTYSIDSNWFNPIENPNYFTYGRDHNLYYATDPHFDLYYGYHDTAKVFKINPYSKIITLVGEIDPNEYDRISGLLVDEFGNIFFHSFWSPIWKMSPSGEISHLGYGVSDKNQFMRFDDEGRLLTYDNEYNRITRYTLNDQGTITNLEVLGFGGDWGANFGYDSTGTFYLSRFTNSSVYTLIPNGGYEELLYQFTIPVSLQGITVSNSGRIFLNTSAFKNINGTEAEDAVYEIDTEGNVVHVFEGYYPAITDSFDNVFFFKRVNTDDDERTEEMYTLNDDNSVTKIATFYPGYFQPQWLINFDEVGNIYIPNVHYDVASNIQKLTCNDCDVPSISMNISSPIADVSESINFNGLSSSNIRSWEWDFGDGTTSFGQNVPHAFREPGIYTITLTANSTSNEMYTYVSENAVLVTDTDSPVIYRFYNMKNGAHLYTSSSSELLTVKRLTDEWKYEGPKYQVFSTDHIGTLPVYRFWNSQTGAHLYTISETEKNTVMATLPQYVYEGIKFYVYENQEDGTKPVYRFFNTINGAHLYTDSEEEKASVMKLSHFQYEGTKFFVL